LFAALTFPGLLTAQSSTNSQVVGADTFVSSGEPGVNFGIRGAAEIAAPTASQPRTEIVMLRFDTSGLKAGFDAEYGVGNWTVTLVWLTLFSSVAQAGQQPNNASFNKIAAGGFEFDLLSNNNWSETGITWNTLSTILPGANNNTLTSLGTFVWDANGEASSTWTLDTDPTLSGKIYNGDEVTIMGQPTPGSTVGYLFNTLTVDPGYLNVSVMAVPEPSTPVLIAGFACVAACLRRRYAKTGSLFFS